MSNVKIFKDKDGNYIYPVTHASVVFDNEGNNIEEKLNNVNDIANNVNDIANIVETNILSNGYIHIDSIEGIVKYETEQEALNSINTCTNAAVLNAFINNRNNTKNIKFGSGYYPFEAEVHVVSGLSLFADNLKTTLLFPQSRGLVAVKKEYCSNVV